jgi:hypothetical protein
VVTLVSYASIFVGVYLFNNKPNCNDKSDGCVDNADVLIAFGILISLITVNLPIDSIIDEYI